MSWPKVKLGEIFTISRGGSPRPIQDYITDSCNGVNWIMIGDTEPNSKYIRHTAKKIKFEGVKKSRKVYPGDLLLTNSMSFGRPYILDVEGCIHDGWLVLSPKNNQIHIDYFYHYLNSPAAKIIISNKAAGAVVKNLNSDIVRNLEIPFPPFAEQVRIASTLDKVDGIRQKREQAIKLADDFLRATFLEMFGDPVENPKKLKKSPITELADVITGFAFKSNEYINDSSEAVRLCRGANTLTGYLDWADTKFWPKNKLEKLDNYLIKAGDIILAMDRPWISSGLKVCIFPENQRETYLVQRVARLRPRCESYTNYIYSCIKSPAFEKHCCPTETTVPHISPVELKNFEVLIPPDELMVNFHSIVSIINNSLNKMASGDIDSDALFSKLSQQAFSGHLKR
ncbi:restriction endonuclease subunit S [Salmonella enterica]|nr:restriction endonuclease subunit S [Salmonella enterica subsp. salamae]ECL1288285.1 restriction endonuclease subunit S [Salmonella enterica]ECJ2726240.1 restriction endonuclease subunit S [Salmonella enterica subsp. salamae]EEA0954854.1 restriction endonuclease subunit S [Salmonella enterica]EGH5308999.1 restriction endonuclease subunit S [Salmonella enterica]